MIESKNVFSKLRKGTLVLRSKINIQDIKFIRTDEKKKQTQVTILEILPPKDADEADLVSFFKL